MTDSSASRDAGEGRRNAERLRLLSELAREFAASTADYEGLLALIARRLGEAFADLCVIRLVSDDRALLEAAAVFHPDAAILAEARAALAEPERIGEGLLGRVAETRRAALVPVLDDAVRGGFSPERRALLERVRAASLLVAPLVSRGSVIGTVSLTRRANAQAFDRDDLEFVQLLADHAALAIANAQSYAAAVRANETLARSEEAHRILFDASPVPLIVFDVDTLQIVASNAAAQHVFGYDREELLQVRMSDLAHDDHEAVRARTAQLGDAETLRTRRYYRKDGSPVVVEFTSRPLLFRGRRSRITVVKDVTALHAAEQTRALLAAMVDGANDAILSTRLDGTITSWNPAAERLFGYAAAEVLGQPVTMIIPPDRLDEEARFRERIARGEIVVDHETTRLRKDGCVVPVSLAVSPIFDASANAVATSPDAVASVIGTSRIVRDLTAQKRSEEALRQTEDQLRQAQKLEAIGRLAGGVAHDFNNLLSVIMSYTEMLQAERDASDPDYADLEEIRAASVRAADLTRQLLAFSRQQVVQPQVLDLNDVLSGVRKMLERVLGEDIELVCRPTPGLGRVLADPCNVEQVIMNLAVNARDAMPNGGKLTIETRDVTQDDGRCVVLAVTDGGTGMDEETRSRMFEPFFTTKPMGKGTGLGLATVFGIVKQAGGSIFVDTQLGKGTTFRLYFPHVDEAVRGPQPSAAPANARTRARGRETILLVEDQDQLRNVVQGILRREGYEVIAAANGPDGLRSSEQHAGRIDLLVTDIVMPQMSGGELARRLLEKRPALRVLYMSGHTDDGVIRQRVVDSEMAFLQKPFTPQSLARKVREVLDVNAS